MPTNEPRPNQRSGAPRATGADRAFQRYLDSGRPEDLACVFDVCAPQLLLFASHITTASGDAEDLVQATFLRAIEAAHRFQRGRPVLPWLIGILVREARKARREAGRVPDPSRLPAAGPECVPLEVAELSEFQDALRKALEELPPVYREILTLRLIHGLAATEIAHARGASPDTVKTQLRRGAERLRALLPAGFASAVVVSCALGRGLAGVREVVLGMAAQAAAASTASVASAASAASAATRARATGRGAEAAGRAAGVGRGAAAEAAKPLAWTAGVGVVAAAGWLAFSSPDPGGPPAPPERRPVVVELGPSAPPPRTAPVTEPPPAEVVETPAPDPGLVAFLGRVVGERGRPLPDTRVQLVRLHPEELVMPAAPLPRWTEVPEFLAGEVLTDVDGRFAIEGVLPWGTFLLRLDAGGGRADLRLVDRPPEPGEHLDLGDLPLGPRRLVKGRIVDRGARPVAAARLRPAGLAWSPPDGSPPDGSPPEGALSLGLPGAFLEALCRDDFEPDGALVVEWGGRTQVLVPPAWCRALFDLLMAYEVETDSDGRFEWIATRPGPIAVTVSAPGFARRRVRLRVPGDTELFDAGSFALQGEPNAVSGTVLDAAGDPVPGAEVMLGTLARGERVCCARPVAVADERGGFRVEWAEPGEVFALARRGPGEPWHVSGALDTLRHVSVRLPARDQVVVRVTDRSGAPIAAPELRLLPGSLVDGEVPGTLTMHQLGFVEPLDLTGRRARVDRGVVRLTDVPHGDWTVIAAAPGHAPRAVPLPVDGVGHETVELTELEETVIAVDDAGFRIQDGLAILARAPGRDPRGRVHEFPVLAGHTDRSGELRLPRRRWRPLALGAARPQLGWAAAVAEPGAVRLELTMRARGVVEGRLTDGGEPARAGAWLVAARPAPPAGVERALCGPPIIAALRPGGGFRFPALEAGRYEVFALRAPRSLVHPSMLLPVLFPEPGGPSPEVDLVPDGHARLVLDARPAPVAEATPQEPDDGKRTLHGTVRIDGRPGVGLAVVVWHGGRRRAFPVAADGAFDCGFAPAGPLHVAVVPGAGIPPTVGGARVDGGPVGPNSGDPDGGEPEGRSRVDRGAGPGRYLWRRRVAFGPGRRPSLDIELVTQPLTCALTTADGARASGIEVVLEGVLDGVPGGSGAAGSERAARSRFTVRADDGGWFELGRVPAGRYTMRAEHPALGWLAKDDLRVGPGRVNVGLSIALEPLLAASGRAVPRRLGVDLPVGSKVEFVRRGGGARVRRSAYFGRRGAFRVESLLPGKYQVTIRAARVVTNAHGRTVVIPAERSGLVAPQGMVEIGPRDRTDLVLQRRLR